MLILRSVFHVFEESFAGIYGSQLNHFVLFLLKKVLRCRKFIFSVEDQKVSEACIRKKDIVAPSDRDVRVI